MRFAKRLRNGTCSKELLDVEVGVARLGRGEKERIPVPAH
jgi:hypothetical protein